MVSPDPELPLIVVLGATGSGKSELALTLAQQLQGEILNFDSVQVYRGFDIGSAKLPVTARRGIPHHLIDIADPTLEVTAGLFAREARAVLSALAQRGRLPILVGGTGFYLRALLDGLSPAPERDHRLRTRLASIAQNRPVALYRFLRRFDPTAAQRIHPNDLQKLTRAVEMTFLAQRPASQTQSLPRTPLSGYRTLKLGLNPDRQALYGRINQRSAHMFEHGLLDEAAALLQAGVPKTSKPMQSLGYKQAVATLEGVITVAQAIEECQTKTRQYAKRQLTWFRQEPGVHWLNGFGSEPHVLEAALSEAHSWTRNNEHSGSS